jgi:hypothetical protein
MEKRMSRPHVLQGTGEELLAYLEQHRSRANLTLIIPVEESAAQASPEEVAAANRRLRAHVHPFIETADLDNEGIDADLVRAYSPDSQSA